MEPRAQNLTNTRRLLPFESYSLVISNLLLSGLFALMMWRAVPREVLLIWLTASAVIGSIELIVRLLLSRAEVAYAGWRRLTASSLDVCVGLLWLYAAVFFFPLAQSNLQFFWLFSLAAPALCTAVYQHADLPASFARIGFALPVAAVLLFNNSASLGTAQAGIVIGLWASLIWLAARLHRSLRYRISLMANRDTLLRKVADNARDLDALRAMESASRELAESANLAKSRFLAHSSHDLRQPLHAISLLLETVDEESLDESAGYIISRVRQSVELLANLFDSLLDLTLLDTGQVEVRNLVFDVDDVFSEVASDFSTVAEAGAVAVNVEKSGVYINADPTIVRRMVQNLLANAIRYSADGVVTLRSRRVDNTVHLEVEDSGSGIAPDDQRRIFEEFTKLDTSVKGQSAGSLGLGLAIVDRMARLSNVQITVDSEPSRGSCFSIGPFLVYSAVEIPALQRRAPVLDLRDVRIVVVDDDQDTLKATGMLLRKWGMAATLLVEGDLANMPKPGILVCDYELGADETGVDVINNARVKYGERTPALLISGNTSPELAMLAQRADLRLLHKPVRPAQLKSAILTLLGTAADENAPLGAANGE